MHSFTALVLLGDTNRPELFHSETGQRIKAFVGPVAEGTDLRVTCVIQKGKRVETSSDEDSAEPGFIRLLQSLIDLCGWINIQCIRRAKARRIGSRVEFFHILFYNNGAVDPFLSGFSLQWYLNDRKIKEDNQSSLRATMLSSSGLKATNSSVVQSKLTLRGLTRYAELRSQFV